MASVGWLGPQFHRRGMVELGDWLPTPIETIWPGLKHERLDLLSGKSEQVHSFRRSPENLTCLHPGTPQALRLALPTELELGQ